MKKHISLLVAAVMVLTLIYTPAGLVYAAEDEAQPGDLQEMSEPAADATDLESEPAAEEPESEPEAEATEPEPEPAAEEQGENNQTGEVTVKDVETTGSDAVETEADVYAMESGEITGLTVTARNATSIGLKWDAFVDTESNSEVTYKVFLGDVDKTPEGYLAATTKTISGLTPKTDYPFIVKAYKMGVDEPIAEGTFDPSASYTYPKPNPAAPTGLTVKKSFPDYVISWTKDTTKAGYQFRYSTKKDAGALNNVAATINSRTLQKLKNGKTYYFQVRVKDQYRNSPVYWSGWQTVSFKAATTGWKTVIKSGKKNGKKYYYSNGVMWKNKEFWIKKLKYYVDKNGVWRGGSRYMWNRCKKQTSGTDTMVVTSRNRHTVCIFKKVDGSWCCQYEWLCSVGEKGNRTPHGSFYVRSKKKSFGKGHTCWYATRYHKKYPKAAFHSVLYKKGSKTKIKDGRLGKDISNGCVRLALKNAKWIYDNVKKRSRIYIY